MQSICPLYLAFMIELNKRAFVLAAEKRLFTAIRLNADQREYEREGELVKKQGVGRQVRRTTTMFRTVRVVGSLLSNVVNNAT